jgi:hypothetical protein
MISVQQLWEGRSLDNRKSVNYYKHNKHSLAHLNVIVYPNLHLTDDLGASGKYEVL